MSERSLTRPPTRGLTGSARAHAAGALADLSRQGRSPHEWSSDTGYSSGFVRRLLLEAGVTLRAHGGDHRHAG